MYKNIISELLEMFKNVNGGLRRGGVAFFENDCTMSVYCHRSIAKGKASGKYEVSGTIRISIKLPEPKKNTLKLGSMFNFVLGVGMMAVGVIFMQKWCAIAGE